MKTHLALTTVATALLAAGVFTSAGPARASDSRHDAASNPVRASWCAGRCDTVITDWNLTAFQVIKAGDGYVDPTTRASRPVCTSASPPTPGWSWGARSASMPTGMLCPSSTARQRATTESKRGA